MEDISLLCSEIFDSIYQSTVFYRLNTVCTNSCEKPWRQNSIMTDLQHLLHWTLFVWRKGLCSANKSRFLPLSHATVTPRLPQHHGQSDRRRDELLPTSKSLHEFIQFPIYSSCHLVNRHFLAATWPLYTSQTSSLNPTWILCAPVIHTYGAACFCGLLWMDGMKRGVLFTSLHDPFKNLRADASAGWLNDGWHPQPTCLSPMKRHLRHLELQQNNAPLKSCLDTLPHMCGTVLVAMSGRLNQAVWIHLSIQHLRHD